MLLLFLIFVWGASWPIYKLALPYTPPILFAGMRATIGGLLLAVTLFNISDKINWRENWRFYCISALLNTTLFFGIQTVGLKLLTWRIIFYPCLLPTSVVRFICVDLAGRIYDSWKDYWVGNWVYRDCHCQPGWIDFSCLINWCSARVNDSFHLGIGCYIRQESEL